MQADCKRTPGILLEVRNNHGTPTPTIRPKAGEYSAYFENEFGEQWCLTISKNRTRGILRGGDVDWTPHEIRNNRIESGIILSDQEFAWLSLSWKTATGRELTPPPMQRLKEFLRGPSVESEVLNLEAWRKSQGGAE
ncbi:MAG: hypothetical protein RIC55_08045 [Pirellulaceae bacterium]